MIPVQAIPCAWAVMATRRREDYEVVLNKLREFVPQLQPSAFKTDFEAGLIAAIRNVFPGVPISGCWYHYMAVSI